MVRTALVLVLVAVFFAVGGGIIYVKNQTATQTFTSNSMKVQFEYPAKYIVSERFTTGSIHEKSAEKTKGLRYGKYGTNYPTALAHVKSLNSVEPTKIETFESPYSSVFTVKVNDGKSIKSYFFVKDYAVYYFSTDDPALFSDLDAIAKSFRILQ